MWLLSFFIVLAFNFIWLVKDGWGYYKYLYVIDDEWWQGLLFWFYALWGVFCLFMAFL